MAECHTKVKQFLIKEYDFISEKIIFSTKLIRFLGTNSNEKKPRVTNHPLQSIFDTALIALSA